MTVKITIDAHRLEMGLLNLIERLIVRPLGYSIISFGPKDDIQIIHNGRLYDMDLSGKVGNKSKGSVPHQFRKVSTQWTCCDTGMRSAGIEHDSWCTGVNCDGSRNYGNNACS